MLLQRLAFRRCVSRLVEPILPCRKLTANSRTERPDLHNGRRLRTKKLTLAEQLFPDRPHSDIEEAGRRAEREIPRLSLDELDFQPNEVPLMTARRPALRHAVVETDRSSSRQAVKSLSPQQDEGWSSILRLDNASKHLTLADFNRLLPQGQHLEGWTTEQSEILRLIPSRTRDDLAQGTQYYLQFSSPTAAREYQKRITSIHKIVRQYAPRARDYKLPVPSGYEKDGIDVAAAIAAYTILSPDQDLYIYHIKTPLIPQLARFIDNGGLPTLISRRNRMPYELRITLYGTQVPQEMLRKVFIQSGKDRGLAWSGGLDFKVDLSDWSTHLKDDDQRLWGPRESRTKQIQGGWRRGSPVYVIGCHTEHAALSFLHYWHKRPLDDLRTDQEFNSPPIVEVETLW